MSELDIDAMVTGPSAKDKEIESLQDQLAKANEHVRELTQHLKSFIECHSMVVYTGSIMEQSKGVAGWHLNGEIAEWDDLFTVEAYQEYVKKFAIEKKLEMLREAREPFYQKKADLALIYGIGGSDCKKVTAWFDSEIEKLSKELVK